MRRLGRLLARERGTALVELSLALPIVLLLVIGMFDLGRAVYTRNFLATAARDGARFATVDPANATCVRLVASRNSSFVSLTPANVTYAPPASLTIDQPVTVTVSRPFQPLTPMVATAIGRSSLNLSASTTMRVRNVAAVPLGC